MQFVVLLLYTSVHKKLGEMNTFSVTLQTPNNYKHNVHFQSTLE